MIYGKLLLLLWLKLVSARLNLEVADTAFDQQLYEDVLDAEECDRQVKFIRRNPLLTLQFADAGIRVPRGLLQGNNVDLGNYYQCLDISHKLSDMYIQGKYCSILVPMNQTFHLPNELEFSDWAQLKVLQQNEDLMRSMGEFERMRSQIRVMTGVDDGSRTLPVGPFAGTVLRLAVCIPKPCTTQQAMTSFIFNLTTVGFQYEDDFCRLPNDKPWAVADYVAIAVFSFIGFLTILSTSYDLFYTFYVKIDRKQLSAIYTSFSVYTNGKRLMYFPSGPGNLQCMDGMRSLAMAWVILGHTFSSYKYYVNGIDGLLWLTSLGALWVTSGTITVDTFFTIAGVLIVYTTAGKMDGMKLLKNLHLFYLNRLMRMFPLLAAVVLLQASYFNQMSDGPTWTVVSRHTNNCRTYWWTTLLHVQNLLNPRNLCINHSWYVAIDVQCYIVSPLVLFWVLGGQRRTAWAALILGFLAILGASTIYNFIYDFQSATVALSRPVEELIRYMDNYYFFTLTRAAPFFVGMIFGYVLHVYRNEKVNMPWLLAIFMWVCALAVTTTVFFHTYFIKQLDWDNQLADNFINSFIRPAWGAALCWIIFACVHGYGGPVNWFLTLDIWKMPARLSYAMFLFHYPIMFVICDSVLSNNFFSVPWLAFQFLAHFTLSLIVAYVATLLIDSPFSTIVKKLLTPTPKPKPKRPLSRLIGDDKEKAEARSDATTSAALLNANRIAEPIGSNEINPDSNAVASAKKNDALQNNDVNASADSKNAPNRTSLITTIDETDPNLNSDSGTLGNEPIISNTKAVTENDNSKTKADKNEVNKSGHSLKNE